MDCIKRTISQNESKKKFFNNDFRYSFNNNDFFYYEDELGKLKLPLPNVLGQFQLDNISVAIATLKSLNLSIKEEHIKKGITKISNLARLQEIKSGKLKALVKNNKLIVDGTHNEDGARVLNEYLKTLNCKKHVIISMMANKEHEKYISHFKDVSSITTIDLKSQPNSITGKDLKKKFKVPIGFSDHTTSNETSLIATALGAEIIEKHFTLDKKLPGPDHALSADPKEFKNFVKSIKLVNEIKGKNKKTLVEGKSLAKAIRRSIFANRTIKSGSIIKIDDIKISRPVIGIEPKYMNKIIGKKIAP